MEIGHNILHGQWDWMNDPEINSGKWEWDTVCPADQWKHSHNVVHHTFTNVIGKDRDVGYEILRVTEEQPWKPAYLFQPFYNALLMVLFEWGVAMHDVDIKKPSAHLLKGIGEKALRQVLKDYVFWPALAGPFFLWVLLANAIANLMRNVWSYMIIFCGHFPEGVHLFHEEDLVGETRARWYLRQVMGSCNIEGGPLFHIMSGNLSHQIEHHLFPDIPSNRYPEIAPRVREICARYGVPYNSGSLWRQFGTTTLKIWRLAFPAQARVNPTYAR
jgi:linoleoyl-CoA desaturase